jgi:Phosphotransferase enzyme family
MRQFPEGEDIPQLLQDSLGEGYHSVDIVRLRGGTRKGVYRVLADGPGETSVIVYRWAESENLWPGELDPSSTDPLAPVSGLAPFLIAQRTLSSLGVRVPRVLFADAFGRRSQTDFAVVEDVSGGTLEALLEHHPAQAAAAMEELAAMLDTMHRHQGRQPGRLDVLEQYGKSNGEPCEQRIFEGALRDVARVALRDARIERAADALRNRLRELAAQVNPRKEYGLIHGELGPDHVLIDADGHPVLIDIEGVKYFDIEWEHVFLKIRFGEHYATLSRSGLDRRRLDLYTLAMRLSLVAGPLRLLEGDLPDREGMRWIAEHNLKETLALLG